MVSDGDQYPTTQPAKATYPDNALRNNSKGRDLDKEALERFKIREICEGWGVYRDAAEWSNYRSMFFDDAYIATSWNQGNIDEFIEASKEGFAKGSSFMYTCIALLEPRWTSTWILLAQSAR
ncbi:hypothetical protein M3J09_005064 [Ascochyta lentis]